MIINDRLYVKVFKIVIQQHFENTFDESEVKKQVRSLFNKMYPPDDQEIESEVETDSETESESESEEETEDELSDPNQELIMILCNYEYYETIELIITEFCLDKNKMLTLSDSIFIWVFLRFAIDAKNYVDAERLLDIMIKHNILENNISDPQIQNYILMLLDDIDNTYDIFKKIWENTGDHLGLNLETPETLERKTLDKILSSKKMYDLIFDSQYDIPDIIPIILAEESSFGDFDNELLKALIESNHITDGEYDRFVGLAMRHNQTEFLNWILTYKPELYDSKNIVLRHINSREEFVVNSSSVFEVIRNIPDIENPLDDYLKDFLYPEFIQNEHDSAETENILELLEYIMEKNQGLPQINVTDLTDAEKFGSCLHIAIENNHPHLLSHFMKLDNFKKLSNEDMDKVMELVFFNPDASVLKKFIENLPTDSKTFKKLLKNAVAAIDTPVIDLIIENHLANIYKMESTRSDNLLNIIRETRSPLIAKKFMQQGIQFDSIEEARFREMEEISANLNLKTIAEKIKKMEKAYGLGFGQDKYQEYFTQISGIIAFALQKNEFKLAPPKPTSSFLKSEQPKTACLTLEDIGKWRQWMALLQRTKNYELFGSKRDSAICTPLTNERYAPFYFDFYEQYKDRPQDRNLVNKGFSCNQGTLILETQILGYIDDQPYGLTGTSIMSGDIPVWDHADSDSIQPVLAYVDKLIYRVINEDLSSEETIDECARIHWWMAQATPFFRGSAAITEMLLTGLFLAKGMNVSWHKPLPDCRALSQPHVEQFINDYQTFTTISKLKPAATLAP